MVSVATDGANVMSGIHGGAIKHLKDEIPNLLYSICCSHTFNLTISAAIEASSIAPLMTIIQRLHSFFSFPKREAVLKQIFESKKLKFVKLIDPSPTRQIQRLDAVVRMRYSYKESIEALREILKWNSNDTVRNAENLLKEICSKDFALNLVACEFFMAKITPTARLFQKKNTDISKAFGSLTKTMKYFEQLNFTNVSRQMIEEANV